MSSPESLKWSEERPHTLVVACSDGRLEEQTDQFLHGELDLTGFDRFYVPGGGGALASSGRDFLRAVQLRRECAYLIELHEVSLVILLFHGPAENGPAHAVCADYRRKLPLTSPALIRIRQHQDVIELMDRRSEWSGNAEVKAFRCDVDQHHNVSFSPFEV